jgi:hypothetical protein
MSPFRPPVSASEISVPDSNVRDRFDDWLGSWQFDPFCLHHPVSPNRGFPGGPKRGRSWGDFRRYYSGLSVSGDGCCLSGRFRPPVSASKNSVPRRRVRRPEPSVVREPCEVKRGLDYCGFNPSASNCLPHSAGASRKRSTPMPRGSRPSTAALTRSGARKASEIVMLTWRTLHFCRVAIC